MNPPQAVHRSPSRSSTRQPIEKQKAEVPRGRTKAAAKGDEKEKKDPRKGSKVVEGVLRAHNPKVANKVDNLRRQVAEVQQSIMSCLDNQESEGKCAKKRGFKSNKHPLKNVVDHLENLYIQYQSYPYNRHAPDEYKDERARRRNEISAVESRIKKRLEDVRQEQGIQKLKNSVKHVTSIIGSFINQEEKNKILDLVGIKRKHKEHLDFAQAISDCINEASEVAKLKSETTTAAKGK